MEDLRLENELIGRMVRVGEVKICERGNCMLVRVCTMQRLLPQVENPEWMMIQGQSPPIPTPHTYVIRPYREEDKVRDAGDCG